MRMKVWKEALGGDYKNYAAKFNDIVFLPHSSLSPMIVDSKFYLSQYDIPFAALSKYNETEDVCENIELIPRDKHEQLEELIVDVDKLSDDVQEKLEIDLKLIVEDPLADKQPELKKHVQFMKVPLSDWKNVFTPTYASDNIRFLESSADSQGRRVVLSKPALGNLYMYDVDNNKEIPCKTFMRFQVVPFKAASKDPANNSINLPNVRAALKHDLTETGKMTLKRVIKSLTSRFGVWKLKSKDYYAPVVSLCQSSGSGKTKISLECLKQNPGFYLVFRDSESSGYPFTNALAEELNSIVSNYNDPSTSLFDFHYDECAIGRILDFLSRIITTYVQNIDLKAKLIMKSSGLTETQAVQQAIHDLAKLFEENELLPSNFNIISKGKMDDFYIRLYAEKTPFKSPSYDHLIREGSVGLVSMFIKYALEAPQICFSNAIDPTTETICIILAEKFKSFPFLFVLDEADLIKKGTHNAAIEKSVTGFEIVRRALGYLERDSQIMFMTLGTKSDIIDLNTPVLDMSRRFLNRSSLLEPITFNSNSNIFSIEYPIRKIKPSYRLLQNPLMFKFLATLGHGLWGSFPFNTLISSAKTKLENGSTTSKAYFLPVWMVRTGIAAQPFHIGTKTLVANNMATLFDTSKDLSSMTVSYPSEPILAMASRTIINESKDESLFQILRNKIEAVSVDVGRHGEIFAAMIVLRSIDCAPNRALSSNYPDRLKEISELLPHFSSLWAKKRHVLEPEDNQQKDACSDFPDYKICTVEDFLNQFTNGRLNFGDELPSSIREGIVNASHMVNLTRDKNGFSLDSLKFKPRDLPLADSRIKDYSINVIDATLLKAGLIRQCGFFLPVNYYGLDFIIPVCLKNDQLTYIGVQVKRSNANTDDDVYKMQNRFHYVNCAKCGNSSGEKCEKCCYDRESLKEIYANSVTILISLDEYENMTPFTSSVKYNLEPRTDLNDAKLLEALNPKSTPQLTSDTLQLDGECSSFFKPLVQEIDKVDDGLALIKSIWIDKFVNLTSPKELSKIKKFYDDGFVHRQFCIATRGWKSFENLFHSAEKCFDIANDMMSSEGLFQNCDNRSDPRIIRNVLLDTSPSYFQYVDELWTDRSDEEETPNLEKLDSFESNDNEISQKSMKVKNSSDKIDPIGTPPASPSPRKK